MVFLVRVAGDGKIVFLKHGFRTFLTPCRIFIIEGLPTVVMGVATLWLLPNDPDHVSSLFLSGSDDI